MPKNYTQDMKVKKSIFVNQLGYASNGKKFAYVRALAVGEEKSFCLKKYEGNKSGVQVFEGKLQKAPEDNLSGELIYLADFSNFSDEGNYVVCVGKDESFPVHIFEDYGKSALYGDLFYSLVHYFYLSRCGEDIDGGKWSHAACHTGVAEVYGTGEQVEVSGGWHDAGDYGRYVVPGAKAVMDLLLAYEAKGFDYSRFDILAEVRFELEWMLALQRKDGAVYHKISCYHFCGFINPADEKDKLVISPVSTAATADFAGCLAFAAKFYQKSDAAFSTKLINAAKKAQLYLDSNPDELFKNPQEITTGGYGDWNVRDERFFALCALFEATNDISYLQKALEVKREALAIPEEPEFPWKKNWFEAFTWGCVSGYGTEILLKNKEKVVAALGKKEGEALLQDLKASIVLRAEGILKICKESAFGVCSKFIQWGSNGFISDEAHLLLLAYDLTGNQDFVDAAKRQVDYILGCNPFGICYVTGNGVYRTENPHHRPSGAVGEAMPGMLAGGPSAGLQDSVAKENLEGRPPLQCYLDVQGSYSTNEIAIYWNSPFVYVLAKLGLA